MLAGAIYIDAPLKSIAANVQQARQWQKVSKYQLLQEISSGNDGASAFADTGSQLNQDIYDLYEDVENKSGVYLISSSFNSKNWLQDMRASGTYKNLPNQPFWEMKFSANYLKKIHFKVSKKF